MEIKLPMKSIFTPQFHHHPSQKVVIHKTITLELFTFQIKTILIRIKPYNKMPL